MIKKISKTKIPFRRKWGQIPLFLAAMALALSIVRSEDSPDSSHREEIEDPERIIKEEFSKEEAKELSDKAQEETLRDIAGEIHGQDMENIGIDLQELEIRDEIETEFLQTITEDFYDAGPDNESSIDAPMDDQPLTILPEPIEAPVLYPQTFNLAD